MATVKIAHQHSDHQVSVIKWHLDSIRFHNPNFNGIDFVIERDDHTCIEGVNEIDGTILLTEINEILQGEHKCPQCGRKHNGGSWEECPSLCRICLKEGRESYDAIVDDERKSHEQREAGVVSRWGKV